MWAYTVESLASSGDFHGQRAVRSGAKAYLNWGMVRTYSFTALLLTSIGHYSNETKQYSEDLIWILDLSHLHLTGDLHILFPFLFGTWERV